MTCWSGLVKGQKSVVLADGKCPVREVWHMFPADFQSCANVQRGKGIRNREWQSGNIPIQSAEDSWNLQSVSIRHNSSVFVGFSYDSCARGRSIQVNYLSWDEALPSLTATLCCTYMFEIIKEILILHKDSLSKYLRAGCSTGVSSQVFVRTSSESGTLALEGFPAWAIQGCFKSLSCCIWVLLGPPGRVVDALME